MPKIKNMLENNDGKKVSLLALKICEKITRYELCDLMDMQYSTLTGKVNMFNKWSYSEIELIVKIAKKYKISVKSLSSILRKIKKEKVD